MSAVNYALVDFWITEYARDRMLSCFRDFDLGGTNEISALIHGKLTVLLMRTSPVLVKGSRDPSVRSQRYPSVF